MTTNSHQGFTVIETMLFLAITGALFAALMIGVGTGVTQQRYLDSVRSYRALIQQQYTAVLNTANSADSQFQCTNATDGVTRNPATQATKGTSNCVILGRVIKVTNNGQSVETASVTGYEPASDSDQAALAAADDITALKLYNPIVNTTPFDLQQTDLDWQSVLYAYTPDSSGKNTTPNRPASTEILILRSPSSGTVKVFVSPTPLTGSIADFLTSQAPTSNPTTTIIDCVDGNSGLLPKQVVTVDTTVASTDGVSASDVPYGKECQ